MEKETAEAVGRAVAENPGLVAAAFGTVMTALGWLGNKFYRSIGHRINNNAQAISALATVVEKKADQSVVDRVLLNQGVLFTQQREDNQRTVDAIGGLTRAFNEFALHIEQEVGKRPTREELAR